MSAYRSSERHRPLLSPSEAAEQLTEWGLDVSTRTLQEWRSTGRGPAYLKIGNQIRYHRGKLSTWIEAHEVKPGRKRGSRNG
ncbi:hypothetical protein HMPREF3157_02150 [Dermabacter sp. HMSC06F07]|uniref:DNA-binding protein n=1 Tax=Dermabacter jinjuensis TaxID=1667168 RepID=A0ABN5DLE1_9MICO|nr:MULTISPECIES: helix-turn-helix domain-containing protein [Dermabacter]ATH95878.1 DNA-binding protein [Dermabacter jinjuensis]OFT48015.1 hypothetical protein HMPREF3157_02150 [Dermabacter sp. HMSC06F07]UEB89936.1 helix-turn-helix domain-containing protein [Dermabacter jinjuensis]